MLYTLAVEITSKPQYVGALRNIMTHQNNGFEKLRCPRENSKNTSIRALQAKKITIELCGCARIT